MKVVKARNLDTKQTYEIEPGKPMSLAVVNTGLRLSFQCKKGDCGSCEFLLNGKKTRSCITKVPTKDFSIKSIKKIGK
jgi:succinate dehydrogenase/fumarate reductase-like Fe-S protein